MKKKTIYVTQCSLRLLNKRVEEIVKFNLITVDNNLLQNYPRRKYT